MHMADALLSPAVGGGMWAVSAGLIWYSSRKVKDDLDDNKVPLMGVLGAFVFAAQMINFTIPGTGSSGHLGGGLLLAVLLGPHAAFITLSSILTIQAFFFADGGLLALGSNIFNLGFYPCFLAYPLIYKAITRIKETRLFITIGALVAAIVSLQLGSFSVVLQTVFSGISELPFDVFVLMMQPIHLAIGLVEGLATAVVVIFIIKAKPDLFKDKDPEKTSKRFDSKKLVAAIAVSAIVISVSVSWFASTHPDGLEWAIMKTSGIEEIEAPEEGVHRSLENFQKSFAQFPDYQPANNDLLEHQESETWPAVDSGTSIAGFVGSLLTLVTMVVLGLLMKRNRQNR